MKTFLAIVLCLSVIDLPFTKATCSWTYNQTYITDTEINSEIFSYEATEVFEFTSWTVTDVGGGLSSATALTYFDNSITDNTFHVKTTDTFKNINNDAYTDGSNRFTITLTIQLTCDGKAASSSLLVQIENTNQNAPEFSKSSFTYSLPMPIMPKQDISLFGDEITATDIDFSTKEITFSVDPDDFVVNAIKTGNKAFRAVFSANQILRFNKSQIYTLTATDSGSPAKSSLAQITIDVDPTSSLDSPSFSSAYYSYNYTRGDPPSFIQTSEDIVIQSDKPGEATFALSGEHIDNFIVDFTNTSNTFSIALKSGTSLPESVSNQIVLTLSFTTDITVNAVIFLTIVEDESVPVFNSDYYVGTYDTDSNTISWNKSIGVSDASDVTISGEKASLFTIDSTNFELKPTSPLSKDDFDDNSNLFLTLIATSTSKAEARAPVVISLLTPDELKFDRTYYNGAYQVTDDKGEVTLVDDIGFSDVTDFTDITIVVDNAYKDNFQIEPALTKWKVTVLAKLNSTTLNANDQLAIPLTATKKGESTQSTAILVLALPKKINFSNSYYTANYTKGSGTNLDAVDLDNQIIIVGADTSTVTMTLDGYSDNFEIKYDTDSSSYQIGVTNNLDDSILANKSLIMTITAENTETSASAKTVLVLTLPEITSSFSFQHDFYAAKYSVDTSSQATVTFTADSIKLTGADSTKVQITVEGYSDYFEIKYDTDSSSYQIGVINNLDGSILANKSLIMTITAENTETSASAKTVLVLTLPEITSSFSFQHDFYAANYSVDTSSQATVTFTADSIKLTGADSTKVQITVEGYSDYFEIKYDTDSSSYQIGVINNLDGSILANKSLIMTITAENTETSASAKTVLVLTLPEITSSFSFQHDFYAAKYSVDTSSQATVTFTADSIKLTGADSTKVQITVEGYSDYFEIKYDTDSSSYQIGVINNLDDSILANKSLIMTITAENTETSASAKTVLVLTLPEITSLFSFQHDFYAANYSVDTSSQATVTFTADSIKLTGADSTKVQITVEGYSDYFEIKYDTDSSSYQIGVINNLDGSILANKSLIMTITAENTETSASAKTVLVLTLPEITSSFSFQHDFYAANYSVDTSSQATVKFTADSIKLTGADSTKVQITVEGYSDYFEIKYDTDSSSYQIGVINNLDDSILANKSLIMTITAENTETSASAKTVLVLTLPEITSSLSFQDDFYAAEYSVDTSSQPTVTFTADSIKLTGAVSDELEFKFKGYENNFGLLLDETSSNYNVFVKQPLNESILSFNTHLIITVTASASSSSSVLASTVLVLRLPSDSLPIFENNYYVATYKQSTSSSTDQIEINPDNIIKIKGSEFATAALSIEGYNDNFVGKCDSVTLECTISVQKNLNASVVSSNDELLVTLIASNNDGSKTGKTVLLINLPSKTSTFAFSKPHYFAIYTIQNADTDIATIALNDTISFTGADSSDITISLDGYTDQFSFDSNWNLNVHKNLDSEILSTKTELIVSLTAEKTDKTYSKATLVIKLPDRLTMASFSKAQYSGIYNIIDGTASVQLTDTSEIETTDINVQITLDSYTDNFEVKLGSDSKWTIQVKTPLAATVFTENAELNLIMTITKVTVKYGQASLLIKLPDPSFTKGFYIAEYTDGDVPSISGEDIVINNVDTANIQLNLLGYENNFDLILDSKSSIYNVIVNQPLNESILSFNTHLIIPVTASTSSSSSVFASTVLVLRLPSDSLPIFENNYYVATYKQSTSSSTDQIEINPDNIIKIKGFEFATAALSIEGYNDNFLGKCDSVTLECTISVQKNLNASIVSSNDELLVTLIASNNDGSKTGKTVLLINLPSKTSTFAFSKPHYFAIYTIQNADTDIATIALNDTISFTGADSSDITISLDGYTDQFSFDSNWNLNVNKNLDSQILSTKTELIVSLTAEKTDKTYSKATLVIKLPDRLTMASFSKAQYSGIYNIIDGTASVQLTDTSEIETTDINVQITLDSYDDNFEVKLSSDSKWTIQVKTPLAATVFTENAELKLIMTITKVSVKYGQASLLIKLPDPSFTKGFYIVEYTDGDVPSISGEDIVINNVDTANIQVNLSEYQEYIYTDLVEDKWVVKLTKPFSVEITSKREILLTILQAIRKSDNVQLATSTLVIKLPDLNTTGAPEFDKFTFNGDYKNSSDKPTVELTDLIGFSSTSTVTVATVVIEESSIYSSYFKLNPRTDGKYDVEVSENLPEDVLNTVTSIVLTLIASSEEGNQDFATLIINLPKVPRETSVQFIDEEILYSGTYENGTFKSPSITLKTNSTDDNKISVEITTELEIDNKYFNYTYKSKVLSLIVDTLPDDILKKYTFIPLKLAITDEDTGDTVHAVFNVNINYNSNDNGGGGGDDDDDHKDSSTGLLVAVIILALLLVAVIVATILLWYFKIRNAKYVKMEEEEVEKQTTKPHPFTKNLSRQTSTSVPSDSSMRRPTGLPIGLIIPDSPTEEAVGDFEISPAPTASMPENEKKVVFDDHVQNIDEYEVIEDEPSENFQNVADRRPTQFIFTYPMEAGLDSPTDADDDERRESTDFDGPDSERKKSVLFDENVERMHIDIDEEDDQDEEDEQDEQDEEDNEKNDKEKESYDVTKQGDLEKFKSELEVKLEEQLAIEILKETL